MSSLKGFVVNNTEAQTWDAQCSPNPLVSGLQYTTKLGSGRSCLGPMDAWTEHFIYAIKASLPAAISNHGGSVVLVDVNWLIQVGSMPKLGVAKSDLTWPANLTHILLVKSVELGLTSVNMQNPFKWIGLRSSYISKPERYGGLIFFILCFLVWL